MSKHEKKSLNDIHEYWKHKSEPETYIKPKKRSEFLGKYVKKYAKSPDSILEIGCNVGRNLNYLYQEGYHKLTGIEISDEAVKLLKKTYPAMAKQAEIICSPIEEIIQTIPESNYHLAFTMAVLEHIHPDSEWVFEEIARVTGQYLITIEAEEAENWRLFPRNYRKVFEQYGLKQIEESNCKDAGLELYTLRIFSK